ncbi:MAG: hypothetical protein OEW35_15200 [Gammaproteobacteria bacterium]|nr:hypothetical protein [Gammaproteobacteria bacterium]MDH5311257.1 hypothetical protein [Gammaproteobacteria bacterium]
MKFRAAPILACVLLSLPAVPAWAERTVVLVMDRSCPVTEISAQDIRKAYLGVAVTIQGHPIRPHRIIGDDLLSAIFFQSIVSMSEKTYERRLLLLLLKYGTPRPQEFRNIGDLVAALGRHQCGIAFMWRNDADEFVHLKSMNLLWQGD